MYFLVYIFFWSKSGSNQAAYETYAYDFLFNETRESFSSMWNFYWNPIMVRKWANVVKAYIISIPPPVINWLWWYIDTFKIVDKNYLPIDFFRKKW